MLRVVLFQLISYMAEMSEVLGKFHLRMMSDTFRAKCNGN